MSLSANERILALRKALGLTRIQFCEQTGVTYNTLEGIERGRHRPNIEFYQAISSHWPHYIAWLMFGELEWTPNPEQREALKELGVKLEKQLGGERGNKKD